MNNSELELWGKREFDLNKHSPDDVKMSGFYIVAKIWKEDNPNADEKDKAKFVNKFFRAYGNRPSLKKGNPSSTIPDPLVSQLVSIRINNVFAEKDITKIHRASMASENLIGALLEEYIAINVIDKGWASCWGTTIKATDFVSIHGDKLQIKNKTNTENSSSNKIREGTNIDVWHRFDARTGKTYWGELNEKIGQGCNLSEDEFTKFAITSIKNNPDMLNLDGV